MEKQRVLITVKTYPTLSRKYGETVCTAGLREDGAWVRMYPVPFRRLNETEQYRKFDWVECRLQRHTADPRPETFRPVDHSELQPVGHLDTKRAWGDRRRLVLESTTVYDRLDALIAAAKANQVSLAVFRPTRVLDFVWENEDREWDPAKVKEMRERTNQLELFADNTWRQTFEIIPKLPYSFSYRFQDAAGRTSELQILDWEVGALYWNCLERVSVTASSRSFTVTCGVSRSKLIWPDRGPRPMRTDSLRKFCPHQFGSLLEVVAAVPPHVKALGRFIGEPRGTEQSRHALDVEPPLCKSWNGCQTELEHEGIPAFDAPEPLCRAVVHIECHEPVGEPSVVDAVLRVTPLSEQNQL